MDLWQRGDEIRIFVERPETDEEKDEAETPEGNEDDNPRAEQWQRELVRTKARFSWRSLKNKDAGSVTTGPAGYSTIDVARFPLDENDRSMRRDEHQVKVLTQNSILIARNFDGLWKQVAGTKAVRIRKATAFCSLQITPLSTGPRYLMRIRIKHRSDATT